MADDDIDSDSGAASSIAGFDPLPPANRLSPAPTAGTSPMPLRPRPSALASFRRSEASLAVEVARAAARGQRLL